MGDKTTCANCTQEIYIGRDAIRVDEGVIGTKEFIPLDETMFFCSEKCLVEFFSIGDLKSVPPRIP